MNDTRKAEYHKTIDMLRRCAQRQIDDGPPSALIPLEGVDVDGPIVGMESRGDDFVVWTARSLYLLRASQNRILTQWIGSFPQPHT